MERHLSCPLHEADTVAPHQAHVAVPNILAHVEPARRVVIIMEWTTHCPLMSPTHGLTETQAMGDIKNRNTFRLVERK